MVDDLRIVVTGIPELQRALRRVDTELPKELRDEFNDIVRIVIRDAQSVIPRRTGAAAGSLVPRSTQRVARLAFGGTRAPYFPWLDFGGRVGRNRSVHRPFISSGRYVYPAIRRNSRQITEAADQALAQMARRAGFQTSGGL